MKTQGLKGLGVVMGLVAISAANAQVGSINSAVIQSRVFNDVPAATFSSMNVYPGAVMLQESGVSKAAGFANRDIWQFSGNGTSAYQFQNGDYFSATFDLTLVASPNTPRKEAGFLFSSANVGDVQFIVNSDAHEVVQFGGNSFYSFNANNGITYTSPDVIRMGLSYFKSASGKNALMFTANGVNSPVFEFSATAGNGALDIGNGSTLGGYLQIVNDPNNPNNSGMVLFQNISIVPIPEPSSLALLGLGLVSLVALRRR